MSLKFATVTHTTEKQRHFEEVLHEETLEDLMEVFGAEDDDAEDK